ncbi:hypothetical protein JQ595_27065 [Bradyrhizobium japonicum]|uniref:hypothetical protein n=1 Tax=Bradyrhizobium japonicum TaxID=375 RepID=UPI001BA7D3B6|nr:hypothetical protein [Bradyrhizobium japonicum]MBR0732417.1 hypothetical protein [Bradyrhizobium japonicum]
MDDRARAIFDEARETLARVADVTVEHRDHDDDGYLTSWSRNMPKKPAPPTVAEVEAMIASRIAEHTEIRNDVHGRVIAAERKRWRVEVEQLRNELGELRADLSIHRAHAGQRNKDAAHTEWMNTCVPQLMANGKDQTVAVAACLNMWRDAWEETHPDGAVDPGPPIPEESDAEKSAGRVVELPQFLERRRA